MEETSKGNGTSCLDMASVTGIELNQCNEEDPWQEEEMKADEFFSLVKKRMTRTKDQSQTFHGDRRQHKICVENGAYVVRRPIQQNDALGKSKSDLK